ncbi:FAD-binding oxidoreductase [Albimonas sp. CAU 1670]|uniref:NAD(P)/FAD-dependent oxidoreductase n=1 Tax=Albimonas sp. CAU 1670 TaxID=3032599 RepID=UPI0023DCCF9C|nr:FAD-binding oxidoreductase [Albimonas sp. CAU 1670]MDF2232058.1 FAD-binding oxidoreductase [Albimonas sp. CAU 1670]
MKNLLYANEAPGALPPSWYAASVAPFPEQPPLEGEVRADVCVIGGGFTGLSTALHLAERGARVVLLEAHRAGWGASGRNGGQIGVGQRVGPETIARLSDEGLAREAFVIGRDAALYTREMVSRHGIDCALKPGVMYVNHRARFDADTRKHVEHLARTYDHDAVYLTPQEVSARLAARGVSGGMLEPSGGHLHPLAFARGLGRAALAAGATIHEMSEATAIEGTTVRTARGAVKADQVIVACNGYLGDLLPEAAAKVMPINNFVLATEPLGERRARALIRDDVAVADTRFVVNYYRLSEDHRMLFGGGESYGWIFPKDLKGFVRKRMLDVFPQLEDAKITHAWGGTLAITPTRLPVWRELRPGVFNASGYSGSGVALATLAGAVLSEALAGDRRRLEVMAKLPVPNFPGRGALRQPILVAAMFLARMRDAL